MFKDTIFLPSIWSNFDDLFDIFGREVIPGNKNTQFVNLQNQKINYPSMVTKYEDKIVYEVAALKLEREDINVQIEGNILSIVGGKKKEENSEKGDALCQYKGIKASEFKLQFTIPGDADIEKTSVKLDKGVLEIVIMKAEQAKPKTFEIK